MSEKKYKSAAEFEAACEAYFASISRREPIMVAVPTGELDKYGHEIFNYQKVVNDNGEEMMRDEYYAAPTVTALCLYLGISLSTFENYARKGGYSAVCQRCRTKIRAFIENEIIMRKKGSTRGLQFSLEHNYKTELTASESQKQANVIGRASTLDGSIETLSELLRRFNENEKG